MQHNIFNNSDPMCTQALINGLLSNLSLKLLIISIVLADLRYAFACVLARLHLRGNREEMML